MALNPGYQSVARHLARCGWVVLVFNNIGQSEREPMGTPSRAFRLRRHGRGADRAGGHGLARPGRGQCEGRRSTGAFLWPANGGSVDRLHPPPTTVAAEAAPLLFEEPRADASSPAVSVRTEKGLFHPRIARIWPRETAPRRPQLRPNGSPIRRYGRRVLLPFRERLPHASRFVLSFVTKQGRRLCDACRSRKTSPSVPGRPEVGDPLMGGVCPELTVHF